MSAVWHSIDQAYRSTTTAAYRTHFKTYLLFLFFSLIPFTFTLPNFLAFLQRLFQNQISPKVIKTTFPLSLPLPNSTKMSSNLLLPDIPGASPSILGFNPSLEVFLMSKLHMPFHCCVTNSLEPFSYDLSMPSCTYPVWSFKVQPNLIPEDIFARA